MITDQVNERMLYLILMRSSCSLGELCRMRSSIPLRVFSESVSAVTSSEHVSGAFISTGPGNILLDDKNCLVVKHLNFQNCTCIFVSSDNVNNFI